VKKNTHRNDAHLLGATVAGKPVSTSKITRNRSIKNRVGERYGKLVVTEVVTVRRNSAGRVSATWDCQCDCGNTVVRADTGLRKDRMCHCGCSTAERQPRVNRIVDPEVARLRARLRGIWNGMNDRCTNTNTEHYPSYGGRGITVCEEWKNDFNAFYEWALTSGHDYSKSLDRINNNAGYAPLNCRWATYKEQNRNRRSTVLNPALAAQILHLLHAGVPPLKIAAQIGYPDRPHLVYNIKNNGAWQ
jgi:hypothetical protein